jgi:hypothetical protein
MDAYFGIIMRQCGCLLGIIMHQYGCLFWYYYAPIQMLILVLLCTNTDAYFGIVMNLYGCLL